MTGDESTAMRDILRAIIMPIHDRGGSGEEVMVMLESVSVGTILALAQMYPRLDGCEGLMAEALADGIIVRLADYRAREGMET